MMYCYTYARLKNRVDFIIWCCEFHNYINDKLGKDQYTCDIATLEERWKYGSPACGYDTPPLDSSSSSSLFESGGDNSNNNSNNGNAQVEDDRSEDESDAGVSGDLNQDLTLPYSQDGEKDVVEGAETEESLQTPDPLIIVTHKDRGKKSDDTSST